MSIPVAGSGAENTELKNKAPRIRSVAYPSFTLQNCIEFTKKIDDEFTGVVFTPREAIAKTVSSSGGALLMRLSSCVQYGLLTLKSNEGYKPTDLYRKIKRPLPSEDVKDFYKECFQKPELYKKLIKDFNEKQLPQLNGLSNILDRNYGVKGAAATLASKIFLTNLQWIECIGEGNTLKLDGGITPIEEVTPDNIDQIEKNNSSNQPKNTTILLNPSNENTFINQKQQVNSQVKEIPVFLKGIGREAKIILPIDFTDEDILKVSKVLSGYLP